MSRMAKQHTVYGLIVLLLLGFLLLAIAPPQDASARPLYQSNNNRATLCGRLVFLEDYKTQARLIGLIPCNQSRPIIFAARPGELFDFYRLTNVVIKKGDKVNTLNYGTLETYITRFDSYKQIYSCRECDPNAASVQPFSAEQASECSAWVLDQAAASFPALAEDQEFENIAQNLQAYANGEVVKQACGVDSACRISATAQQLGVQLGPRLRWDGVSVEQATGWLATLVADPSGAEACPSIDVSAPGLIAGLNQQGYGIDLATIGKGCDLLASDAEGLAAGFTDGSAVEQIPGAGAVAAPQGQYLLLPAGSAARLELACTQNDSLTLQLVRRDETGIRQYTFSRLAVRDGTRGEIDLSASPLGLSLDARGDGNIQERKPDRSLLHPALVALLVSPTPTGTPAPSSATPAPTPSPAPTATSAATATLPPSPTAAPVSTPTATPRAGTFRVCGVAFGVTLLPGIFWLKKKPFKKPAGRR